MEAYDPQLAARVWQRVQNREAPASKEPAPPDLPSLNALISGKLSDAAELSALASFFHGGDLAVLNRLVKDSRAHARCMMGIYYLLSGTRCRPSVPPIPQGTPEARIRRCCSRSLARTAPYRMWESHREYGPVFSRLIAEEWDHYRLLLQILGSLS